MTLHYASNRVTGYGYRFTVPASGDTVPAALKRIMVKINIAGRTLEQTLDPLPNQVAELDWDGLDHLGSEVINPIAAHTSVGFVYQAVYAIPAYLARSFAQAGIEPTTIPAREELIYWKHSKILIHRWGSRGEIGEGWTLSLHHHLSSADPSTLHKGDGTIIQRGLIIDTVAGSGVSGYGGDGGPATEAQFDLPLDVTVDGSGNIYIVDTQNRRIRKVDAEGITTTVAGNGSMGYSGDGGPATEAELYVPYAVAFDASGNFYIADEGCDCVRKVDTNGIIATVAGNGIGGYGGDGGPATEARLRNPRGVAVDASGNLYIADRSNNRIRKVGPDGIITTVAGNGYLGSYGDGGPATEARIYYPEALAVDASGNLYLTDYRRIRKVDTSGIITTIVGNGSAGYSGDGGPAAEAQISVVTDLAVDASGNLYIADGYNNHRIRKVDTYGIITTAAGSGCAGYPSCIGGYSGDGGPPSGAQLNRPRGVDVDTAANIYIADTTNNRIRKVASPFAFSAAASAGDFLFAEESGLGHLLTASGRHEKTIDLDTGIALYEFGYDGKRNLVSITDQFGNQTLIQRDGNGVPTAIISPDGITVILNIDSSNHLTRITYPDNSYYAFEYTADGLLTAKVEPEGNRFEHAFDSIGRLTETTDEEGGRWQFTRSTNANGDILAEVLTGEGDLTSYLDHTDSTGTYNSTITDPIGVKTLFARSEDGLTVNKSLPCGMDLQFKYGIDSEYNFEFAKEMTESTSTSLTRTTLRNKSYQDTNSDDVPDRITETVTVNGKATTLVTDTLQTTRIITSPVGRTVSTAYDPNTLLTTNLSIPGLNETTYEFDARGRLTLITTSTRKTKLTYDFQGNLASITDPGNQTTTYSYDAVGRMTRIGRPDGSFIGFSYDKNGNMTMLTNSATVDHTFGYNKVNLNSSYTAPLSGSYTYLYDKDRRLIQVNFPSGKQINYGNGKLEQVQTPEGSIDLTYLCGTKVDSITKGTEAISYGYDGPLVTSEILSGRLNESLSYSYNNDFNLTNFNFAGGTVVYTYDNDGLLTGAGSFTISRNAANGLPELLTGGALSLSRDFNGYGELEGEGFTVGGRGLISWSLTRDNGGRITARTETIEGVTSNYSYTYDPMGRLLTVTKDGILLEEYQYDSVGTRIYEMNVSRRIIAARSMAYDEEDRLLTAGDAAYQYDADGYLTKRAVGTEETTYNYSTRGELLSVKLSDGTSIEYVTRSPWQKNCKKRKRGYHREVSLAGAHSASGGVRWW